MEIARIVARCLWEENRLLQTAATAAQVRGGCLESCWHHQGVACQPQGMKTKTKKWVILKVLLGMQGAVMHTPFCMLLLLFQKFKTWRISATFAVSSRLCASICQEVVAPG